MLDILHLFTNQKNSKEKKRKGTLALGMDRNTFAMIFEGYLRTAQQEGAKTLNYRAGGHLNKLVGSEYGALIEYLPFILILLFNHMSSDDLPKQEIENIEKILASVFDFTMYVSSACAKSHSSDYSPKFVTEMGTQISLLRWINNQTGKYNVFGGVVSVR